MNYIITPNRQDYCRVCSERNLARDSNNAKWINNWKQLLGVKIFLHDAVILGQCFMNFSPEELIRINLELKLRREIENTTPTIGI